LFLRFFINVGSLCLLLGGCNPFAVYSPSSDDLATQQWAAGKKQAMHKLYCYRTLAEHQCYSEPLKGKDHLLIGEHVVTDTPIKEKNFWEKANVHPFFGGDANPEKTKREELAAEKNITTSGY
jgi:hypothetical protein